MTSIKRAALASDTDATQAFFLSCKALQAADVVAEVGAEPGKPVITSNQASAWALMNHVGLVQGSDNWGRLFQQKLPGAKQGICA